MEGLCSMVSPVDELQQHAVGPHFEAKNSPGAIHFLDSGGGKQDISCLSVDTDNAMESFCIQTMLKKNTKFHPVTNLSSYMSSPTLGYVNKLGIQLGGDYSLYKPHWKITATEGKLNSRVQKQSRLHLIEEKSKWKSFFFIHQVNMVYLQALTFTLEVSATETP
ncbi:hypothetical protein XENORESO_010173 [Xenotaenia resolanae]|uniref:Uncharacterized protein n=1 Tax=Xenotaenia resolanae TaxID=208358 RepID=A0ABV0VRL1_9TELE